MSAGYRPDYWDALRSGEIDFDEPAGENRMSQAFDECDREMILYFLEKHGNLDGQDPKYGQLLLRHAPHLYRAIEARRDAERRFDLELRSFRERTE